MSPWLRQFMLISIVGMTLLLTSLLFFHLDLSRDYLDEHLATNNRSLAALLRNSLFDVGIREELARDLPEVDPAVTATLDRKLSSELKWVPVNKVKIYGTDGTVLYSSIKEEIGRDASSNRGVQEALSGMAVADLVQRDHRNELDGSIEKIDLHQQYIPIRETDGGKIVGVFEIYTDVSAMLAAIGGKQRFVFWTIAVSLLLFYIALAMSFSRTHRLLLKERRRRESHLADLKRVHDELEQRVEERTAELAKQRGFLQSVIDGIGSPLLVIRPDFTIALVNRAARRLIPEDADESEYRFCYQMSHRRDTPCDGTDHPCSFSQVMRHGRPARVRHTHYDANNQPIIVDLLSTPLYSNDGEFEGVIEVEHDVTQIVRMQAGLIESEARLQSIMDNVPDAILTCDAEGAILSVNPSATRLFGASSSDLVGRPLSDFFVGSDESRPYRVTQPMQREMPLLRKDGSEFPAELWAGPLHLGDDPSFVTVIRDITSRVFAQEELEKTRQQYFHQEKMAAIGQLAAGILHEVGNPIAAIAGAAYELKSVNVCGVRPAGECPFDDAVTRNIDLIDTQTNRLAKITREIADFASPRPRECELLDLNSLLRSTARLLSYDRRFRDIQLDLDLDKDLPAIIGVADQLTQVFMNLLINAMDACTCRQATGKATITLSSDRDGDRVQVTVADNGCGMSDETLNRAMEPFYTTKPVGRGTGLGLSLCDSIILAHQGFLHIESVENEGTRVHVFLPIETELDNKNIGGATDAESAGIGR